MENAWQYSKVYFGFNKGNKPSDRYWKWAEQGWAHPLPVRYPFGKPERPLYSWWDGKRLDYIGARKTIYGPLYVEAVKQTDGWKKLKEIYQKCKKGLVLRDYDAYDHAASNMTLSQVLNRRDRKMGHGFVLAMMLTNDPALKQMELRE